MLFIAIVFVFGFFIPLSVQFFALCLNEYFNGISSKIWLCRESNVHDAYFERNNVYNLGGATVFCFFYTPFSSANY